MSLATVREQFIKTTGRYDLVANGDLSANVDAGANAFINRGMRWLDSKVERKNKYSRFIKKLAIGDNFIRVPRLISVKDLILHTATTEVIITGFRLFDDDFKFNFSQPFIVGGPKYWRLTYSEQAADSEVQEAVGQDDLIQETLEVFKNAALTEANPGQAAEPRYWSMTRASAVYNASNGLIAFGGSADTVTQDSADMARQIKSGDIVELTFDVSNWTAGTVTASLGTVAGTGRVADGTYSEVFTAAEDHPSLVFTGDATAAMNILNLTLKKLSHYDATDPDVVYEQLEDNRLELATIQFGVLNDQEYTVEVSGRFYHKTLSADADENWWTVNYPDLLAYAAAMRAEMELQSGTRLKYWQNLMAVDINEIEADATESDYDAAGVTYERTA